MNFLFSELISDLRISAAAASVLSFLWTAESWKKRRPDLQSQASEESTHTDARPLKIRLARDVVD